MSLFDFNIFLNLNFLRSLSNVLRQLTINYVNIYLLQLTIPCENRGKFKLRKRTSKYPQVNKNDKIKELCDPKNIEIVKYILNNSQYNFDEIIFQPDIHTNNVLYFISKDLFDIQ